MTSHNKGIDGNTGMLVGGSSVYLSDEWLARTAAVVAVDPRGHVGRVELQVVQAKVNAGGAAAGVHIIKVDAEPKFS